MGEDGERIDSGDEHVELPPPGERPIKRRGPVVSRRAALGMMVGGAAVGVVGARVGFGSSSGGDLSGIANARGLDGAQAEAALKTYVPGGEFDEFFIMSSGGHSGNVYVIGVPSMRMLKEIPVFTPNAWQGYGYGTDQGDLVLGRGRRPREERGSSVGRHAPPGDLGDRRHLRRPLPLHQRPGQRPHRDGRPARLQDEADPRHREPADVPRRVLRHPEHRVRAHLLDDAVPGHRERVRAAVAVQGGLPRVLDLAARSTRTPAGS